MFSSKTKIIIRSGYVVILVALAVWFASRLAGSEALTTFVARFGYGGVALAALINSFNVFFPVPISTFAPVFIASGLKTVPLIIAIALGMTLGDFLGYWIGSAGRHILHRHSTTNTSPGIERMLRFVESFRTRHKFLPYIILLFYAAFAPTPNELIIIPMGFAGYKLRYMLPIAFIGNIFHTTAILIGVLNLAPLF